MSWSQALENLRNQKDLEVDEDIYCRMLKWCEERSQTHSEQMPRCIIPTVDNSVIVDLCENGNFVFSAEFFKDRIEYTEWEDSIVVKSYSIVV